ncbi:hypothetical protein N2152v2_002707 [Parachlorella kessleri]
MAAPGGEERWAFTPASPALVPILRLALSELSAACQLAAEPLGSAAGRSTRRAVEQAGHTQSSEDQLAPATEDRGECAFILFDKLQTLAEVAADQGRLEVQRLLGVTPAFTKFVDLCGSPASQLGAPQLSMLHHGICGLSLVLKVQRRLLHSLRPLPQSDGAQSAIAAISEQRMQCVAAAVAVAKLLHRASDAAAGNGCFEGGQSGTLDDKIVAVSGEGLASAVISIGYMDPTGSAGPALTECQGGHAACSKLQDAIQLARLAELLVGLVPKRTALAVVPSSSEFAVTQLSRSRVFLLSYAADIANKALAAAMRALPKQQQAQGTPQPSTHSLSSPSGSSRGSIAPPEAEALVHSTASLTGTAAKLRHCLPNLAALDPANARCGWKGSSYWYVLLLETVTELCCCVLEGNPHLAQAPGPQRSLTRHLQSTGFLTFVCLPALAEAHGAMDPYDRAALLERQTTNMLVAALIPLFEELHLIDEAVRGGGLGPWLKQCLDDQLTPRLLAKASSLLLVLVQVVVAEQSKGLAVALVTSGVLQAAAEQSRRLAADGIRRARDMGTIKGILPRHTALLVRAVCSALDDHAGLLTAFSTLLGDVPSQVSRVGRNAAAPGGPWMARFATEQAWEQVCNQLLPALSAACDTVASSSEAQRQNGIFHDVAVSAWTCCNPGCTNMAGQQEDSLALSKCAGCGEARYCSRQCQRQDWRRHKPICQTIKDLK